MNRMIMACATFMLVGLLIFAGFDLRKVDVTESVVVDAPRTEIWGQ